MSRVTANSSPFTWSSGPFGSKSFPPSAASPFCLPSVLKEMLSF